MPEQDLIPVARRVVDTFNASDWEGFKAAMTPDCVYDEVGTSRMMRGVGDILPCFQEWKRAMPDVRGTVTNAWATGNTVVLEISWKGTQTGPLQGASGTVPATGKQQTTRASWVLSFESGKIKDGRHYFDLFSLMQQLGILSK